MAIVGEANSGTYSRADVDRRRKLAEALRADTFQAREPFGALAKALTGARSGFEDRAAAEGEQYGNKVMADRLASKDWQGVMSSEWASPQQAALASALMGRDWDVSDRNASWAREDSRFAQSQALEREKMNQPDWQTIQSGGDVFRWNARDPNSRPEMFFDGPEEPAPAGFRPISPEERAAFGIPDDLPVQVGPDGKLSPIKEGGITVDARNVGNIPPGYRLEYDADGNPVSMAPIPGSPAALEAEAAAAAASAAESQGGTKANIVVQDIDRALAAIEANPALTTGLGAQALGGVGGSPARDVAALIDTVKANAGFAELQAMRAASPTGGALGQVTERELALLQATIGNLETSQSAEQLKTNLRRVKEVYQDIIHGPGKRPADGAAPGGESDGWTDLGNGVRIRAVQ